MKVRRCAEENPSERQFTKAKKQKPGRLKMREHRGEKWQFSGTNINQSAHTRTFIFAADTWSAECATTLPPPPFFFNSSISFKSTSREGKSAEFLLPLNAH